jgi:hypothetical protein
MVRFPIAPQFSVGLCPWYLAVVLPNGGLEYQTVKGWFLRIFMLEGVTVSD